MLFQIFEIYVKDFQYEYKEKRKLQILENKKSFYWFKVIDNVINKNLTKEFLIDITYKIVPKNFSSYKSLVIMVYQINMISHN